MNTKLADKLLAPKKQVRYETLRHEMKKGSGVIDIVEQTITFDQKGEAYNQAIEDSAVKAEAEIKKVVNVKNLVTVIQNNTRCASMELDESAELATAIVKYLLTELGMEKETNSRNEITKNELATAIVNYLLTELGMEVEE